LYRLFKEAGVEECDIHLGNSLDEKGDVFPLDDFLAIFPSLETIVLLGKKAEEAVARAFPRTLKTVEVVKYPHPSFIKRFHYQEVNAWGKNLAQALGL
jgi:hypothetical protein